MSRRWPLPVVVTLAISAFVLHFGRAENGLAQARAMPPSVHSPADSDTRFIPTAALRALVGNKARQSLWHDRQRLRQACTAPATCSDTLGPIANLYALEELDRLPREASFDTERAVAAIEVAEPMPAAIPPGVMTGTSIVYLRRDRTRGTWTGRLEHAGSSRTLSVYRFVYPGDSTPAAAQWDWDPVAGQQLIGVRCGTKAWCVLGASDTVTPTPPPECERGAVNNGLYCAPCPKGFRGAQCAVKGWYDDQVLASPVKAADGRVLLSGVYGVIVPSRGAGAMNRARAFRGAPVVAGAWVSAVYLPGGLDFRKDKLYLYHSTLLNPGDAPDKWEFGMRATRHTKAGLKEFPEQSFALRRFHHNVGSVPGTARWNWRDSDEGIWTRCGAGCCEDVF